MELQLDIRKQNILIIIILANLLLMEVQFMSEFLNKFAQLDPLAPEVLKIFLYSSITYFVISLWAAISEEESFRDIISVFLFVYIFIVAPICVLNFILWIILGAIKYLITITILVGILLFWTLWRES